MKKIKYCFKLFSYPLDKRYTHNLHSNLHHFCLRFFFFNCFRIIHLLQATVDFAGQDSASAQIFPVASDYCHIDICSCNVVQVHCWLLNSKVTKEILSPNITYFKKLICPNSSFQARLVLSSLFLIIIKNRVGWVGPLGITSFFSHSMLGNFNTGLFNNIAYFSSVN